MGIEPTPSAWKAEVLPLNYTRLDRICLAFGKISQCAPNCLLFILIWWRGKDSNLRRLCQQIYSLPPLTAREPLQNRVAYSGGESRSCQSHFFGKIGKIDYHYPDADLPALA